MSFEVAVVMGLFLVAAVLLFVLWGCLALRRWGVAAGVAVALVVAGAGIPVWIHHVDASCAQTGGRMVAEAWFGSACVTP